jgi:hypothetical protein
MAAGMFAGLLGRPARPSRRGADFVSKAHSGPACVNAYNGPILVAHASISNDCPDGSANVDTPAGSMCRKVLILLAELILRPGERCPSAFNGIVDMSGEEACGPATPVAATTLALEKCANGSMPVISAFGKERISAELRTVGTNAAARMCLEGQPAAVQARRHGLQNTLVNLTNLAVEAAW